MGRFPLRVAERPDLTGPLPERLQLEPALDQIVDQVHHEDLGQHELSLAAVELGVRLVAEAHQLVAGEGVLVGFDPLEHVLIVLLSQRAARAAPALDAQRFGGRQHAAAIAS